MSSTSFLYVEDLFSIDNVIQKSYTSPQICKLAINQALYTSYLLSQEVKMMKRRVPRLLDNIVISDTLLYSYEY